MDPNSPQKPIAPVAVAQLEGAPNERILQAALELFVEQGYFNTNIPDISKRSRCSVGSIYHHFLNKEEIADQLYKEGIKKFRKALTQSIQPEATLKDCVRSLVIAFLSFAESHQLLSRYLWLSRHIEFINTKVAHPTTVGFDNLGRGLTKAIKIGIKKGEISKLPAEIIWSILFGSPLSFVRDWLDGYTSQTPAQVAPIIADACWAALSGVR